MKHLDKALLGAGAALLLSGGVAAAALGPTNVGSAVLSSLPGDITLNVAQHGPFGGPNVFATAATYIGISQADLRTQLASGKSLADVAVANGKTRDGLIAALVQASTTEITTLVDTKNPFPAPPAGGRGGPGAMRVGGDDITAAANYLGMTAADLRTKLQAGRSLAQIANATSGKNRDGLIQALVTAETTEIDQAQKDGRITADQATQAKANLTTRITQFVDNTHPMGPGMGPGPRGHR